MTSAIFHPAATIELEEAIDYYEAERGGLGKRFREEVQRMIELLLHFPRIGQRVRGEVRAVMLSSFPYRICYRVLDSGDLRILAVAHNHRTPQYWADRG